MAKKYLMGLDVGTNSVGWAVTDEKSHLIRKNGKCLWGARLFDEAHDASKRRKQRSARRLIARRKRRIVLLRSLFEEEIARVDPNFFIRLDDSALHEEDRSVAYEHGLFGEKGMSDSEYNKKYPTIYHLKYALMNAKEKMDIRLIYLAFAHLIKYRGNYTAEGLDVSNVAPELVLDAFKDINDLLKEMDERPLKNIDEALYIKLNSELAKLYRKSDKKEKAAEILCQSNPSKFVKSVLIPMLCGSELSLGTILGITDEDEKNAKIGFEREDFEERIDQVIEKYGEDRRLLIIKELKKIYDNMLLREILGNEKTISSAMIDRYDLHHQQLKELKQFVKRNHKDLYNLIFRKYTPENARAKKSAGKPSKKSGEDAAKNNYSWYVGKTDVGSYNMSGAHCTRAEFYDFLNKKLFNQYNADFDKLFSGIKSDLAKKTSNPIEPAKIKEARDKYEKAVVDSENVKQHRIPKSDLDAVFNKLLELNVEGVLKEGLVSATYQSAKEKVLKKNNLLEIFCHVQKFSEMMDAGTFLQKINTTDNRVIPHQLNQKEMDLILENQWPFYHPEDDGTLLKKAKDKLDHLFDRLPYFVGPLNSASEFAWAVRTSYFSGDKKNINSLLEKIGEKPFRNIDEDAEGKKSILNEIRSSHSKEEKQANLARLMCDEKPGPATFKSQVVIPFLAGGSITLSVLSGNKADKELITLKNGEESSLADFDDKYFEDHPKAEIIRKVLDFASPISPWNYARKIDEEQSAIRFIERMTSKCSYLHDEDCLPKDSILYCYYNVLNELNNMNVNGESLPVKTKLALIKDVYTNNHDVSIRKISGYLKSHGFADVTITTKGNKEDVALKWSLHPLFDFKEILGYTNADFCDRKKFAMVERIIKECALFEEKSILGKRLKEKYGISDPKKIKQIMDLPYHGFGNLSEKLLNGLSLEYDDNKSITILKMMEQTGKNFMQVLGSGFLEKIEEANDKAGLGAAKFDAMELIDKQYVSPGMKRPLRQAYKIVEEAEKIIGHEINEFYIECNRTNKVKKNATLVRMDVISGLLKSTAGALAKKNAKDKNYINDVKSTQEYLKKLKSSEDLSSDKVYLYCRQLGKDVYTGQPLDLANCDIDHIYPRSFIKDDSLDNKVVVHAKANNEKGDKYPIDYGWFSEKVPDYDHRKFLYFLKEHKLISFQKYSRLMRTAELSEEEKKEFINRQLTYTNQSVKALKELLETKMRHEEKKPKVILSKAEIVSDFRQRFNLVKARDANDLHHAHDALLNVVVGRATHEYYTYLWIQKSKNIKQTLPTNVDKIFLQNEHFTKKPIKDFDGNICFNYDGSTVNYLERQLYANHNVLVSTMVVKGNALFTKAGLSTKAESAKGFSLPIKSRFRRGNGSFITLDPKKYGSYRNPSYSEYLIAREPGKNNDEAKAKYYLVTYPAFYTNDEDRKRFIREEMKLRNFEIVLSGLRPNTILSSGKSKCCITGRTGSYFIIKNVKEAFYSKRAMILIRKIGKMNKLIDFYNAKDKIFAKNKGNRLDLSKIKGPLQDRILDDGNTFRLYKLNALLDKDKFTAVRDDLMAYLKAKRSSLDKKELLKLYKESAKKNGFAKDNKLADYLPRIFNDFLTAAFNLKDFSDAALDKLNPIYDKYISDLFDSWRITRAEMDELFNIIMDQLGRDIYSFYGNLKAQAGALKRAKESRIDKLHIIEYSRLLNEILKLTQCNREFSNLTYAGLGSSCGSIKLKSLINPGYRFVAESVTGFYHKILWERK